MAEEREYDPWSTDSGLMDDVDVWITDETYFGTDAAVRDGQVLILKMAFTTDDPDNAEVTQFYACGPGWEAKDKGQKAVREDGKGKPFNGQTAMGSLVHAIMALDGIEDTMRERGTPMEVATWIGLGFHMERKEFTFSGVKDETTGEAVKTTRLLPTAFLGVKGEGGKAAAPAKKAPAKASKAAPEQVDEPEGISDAGTNGDLPPVIKAKLRKYAKDADTHDQFVEMAFDQLDDAVDYEAVIMDTAFYEEANA